MRAIRLGAAFPMRQEQIANSKNKTILRSAIRQLNNSGKLSSAKASQTGVLAPDPASCRRVSDTWFPKHHPYPLFVLPCSQFCFPMHRCMGNM